MTSPRLPDGQHDQLPPHIRRSFDDQWRRIRAEEQLHAAAAPRTSRWLPWLLVAVTAAIGLIVATLAAVTAGPGHDFQPPIIIATYERPPT